jgi:hypothetical protein
MLRLGDDHGSSVVLSPLDRIAHWKDYLAAEYSRVCCAKRPIRRWTGEWQDWRLELTVDILEPIEDIVTDESLLPG